MENLQKNDHWSILSAHPPQRSSLSAEHLEMPISIKLGHTPVLQGWPDHLQLSSNISFKHPMIFSFMNLLIFHTWSKWTVLAVKQLWMQFQHLLHCNLMTFSLMQTRIGGAGIDYLRVTFLTCEHYRKYKGVAPSGNVNSLAFIIIGTTLGTSFFPF